jgi:hypothetical protein
MFLKKYSSSSSRYMSLDSSVGTAMGYGMDGWVSIPGRDKRFFCTPQRPDRLWGHPASYTIGIGGSFPGGKVAGASR